jgi:hypothetical protein
VVTEVQPVVVIDDDDDDAWPFGSSIGFSLSAGGGGGGFTNENMRSSTDDGGIWDVRASFGTRLPIALEASYIGSLQGVDALGLDTDALLVGNGVQGALRVNATTRYALQPFLFAGVAWRHYEITNADVNVSDIANEDDVLEIPMGVGLAYKYRGFMLDARGEFRAATNEDLVLTRDDSLHRWGVNANLGVEF